MKKIIALAVAGAFVVPAFAADVSISGAMEMAFVSEDDDGTKQSILQEDGVVTIKASTDLGNGWSASADFNFAGGSGDNNADTATSTIVRSTTNTSLDDGGSSLTISGPIGKVDLGETSGAIDSIDDKTDVFHVIDMGIAQTSKDVAMLWTLPTFVDGLSVMASYSPQEGTAYLDAMNDFSGSTSSNSNQAGSLSADVTGYSLTYSVSGVRFAAGIEDVAGTENSYYGVSGALAGIGFAYDISTSGSDEVSAYAVSYGIGDVTVKYASKDADDESIDATTYGVDYKMGDLTFFAESGKNTNSSSEDTKTTAFGASYKF